MFSKENFIEFEFLIKIRCYSNADKNLFVVQLLWAPLYTNF